MPRELLAKAGVKPDFSYEGGKQDTFVDWIHRSDKGTEIYFVANRLNREEKAVFTFRASGTRPELWDPVTGQVRELKEYKATEDGMTELPLELQPYESVFVVFGKKGALAEVFGGPEAKGSGKNFPELKTVQEITGAWQVTFEPKWGGPGLVTFEKLDDWIKRPEEGIKLYSGTATYRKVFDFAGVTSNPLSVTRKRSQNTGDRSLITGHAPLYLSLGSVKYIARVRLNGKDLGAVWTAPWRVEITGTAKTGANELEIDVINLWPNRRIGDASLPEEKRYTHSNIAFSPIYPQNPPERSGLFPSGLLGPVVVQSAVADGVN